MNITLKQLRYFDAVLRAGSIAKAAEEMHISQSSVTAAVDQIEQTVGADLFRRIPAKGIVPTRIGELTGQRVAEFLEQARVFESDLMSITGDPKGTLRLACFEPTAPYVLPPLLKRITAHYPDIRIEITEGDMGYIDEALRSGGVDVALTYRHLMHKTLHFTRFFSPRPWVLAPESWPISQRPTLTFEELVDLPMIMLGVHGTEAYLRGMFEERGLTPRVVHSTRSGEVLRALVAAQLGFSILNICGPADRDGRAGALAVPLAGEIEAPLFGAAYAAPLDQSAIVRAIISTGQALAKEGGYDHVQLNVE